MKEKDRLKASASRLLADIETGKIKGAYASIAVVQEVIFWLSNEKRGGDTVKAVNALLNTTNLEWVDLSRNICLTASALIEEYNLSPFDAYHAATAINRDGKIVSSDRAYDKIKGIERIDLFSFK
ncbi:MAG: type II toxin-antitoxin system VapC family toxin [Candidatus Micrarchaeota archaeon]|nr:type II toxin-antitoxin system VapC family toxin [Candidatus Micrarchaeota archaeon]